MKNIFLYSWLCFLFSISSFSQVLQNNNWVFGTRNTIRFIGDPATNPSSTYVYTANTIPSLLTVNTGSSEPSSYAVEGCASVSDRLGNLLFYTDGKRIFDRSNNLITSDLKGDRSSTQNVIIIPKPNHNKVFYIVTIIGNTLSGTGVTFQRSRGLYYSEIDMEKPLAQMMVQLNTTLQDLNGIPITGDVSVNPRNQNNTSEAITSAIHANGKDYWLVADIKANMASSGNIEETIFSYLVTENGINPIATIATPVPYSTSAWAHSIKISPNNKKLAIATNLNGVYLGNFNNSDGSVVFNNQITRLEGIFQNYGLEFSPNSNFLYYSGHFRPQDLALPDENFLGRYDFANNSNITNSISNFLVGIQRGIDNRIYLTGASSITDELLVINDPDNSNNTNQIVLTSLSLQEHWSHGLPQLVYKQSCENTLFDHEDIPATYLVQEQRTNWIKCANKVSSNARAIYHAGDYILMLPENGTNLGFNAQYGSEFSAYIQGCSNSFVYRNSDPEDTSINEPTSLEKAFIISPNPSSNYIDLNMKNGNFNAISIVSIDGKLILNKTIESLNSYTLDISRYASGMYIVNVTATDGKQYSQKLIKN